MNIFHRFFCNLNKHIGLTIVIGLLFCWLAFLATKAQAAEVPQQYYNNVSPDNSFSNVEKQQNVLKVVSFSNYSENMFHGPFQFNITNSSLFGPIVETKYTWMSTLKDAFSAELDFGLKENRLGLTWGHDLFKNNRFKFTAERLSQKKDFDFDSGVDTEWVSQYALGGEYQQLFSKNTYLKGLNLGGYYSKAIDKSLDPILFHKDNIAWVNKRQITGASAGGLKLGLDLHLWSNAMLNVSSHYDVVNYHKKYARIAAENSSQLGYSFQLNQYFAKMLKLDFSYSHRAVFKTLEAGISWAHNLFHNSSAIELSLEGSHTQTSGQPDDNRVTFGVDYLFSPIQQVYTLPSSPDFITDSLSNWTSTPAVHMQEVLAAANQESVALVLNWPSNLFFEPMTATSEKISWIKNAADNIPGTVITYHLLVMLSNSSPATNKQIINISNAVKPIYDGDVTNTNHVQVNGLTTNTSYDVTITATDQDGHKSTHTGKFTAGNITWNPEIKTMTGSVGTIVNWNKAQSNETVTYHVTIKQGTTTIKEESTQDVTFKITDDDSAKLSPNTNYTVDIIAESKSGAKFEANPVDITTTNGLSLWKNTANINVTGGTSPQDKDATLTWTTPTDTYPGERLKYVFEIKKQLDSSKPDIYQDSLTNNSALLPNYYINMHAQPSTGSYIWVTVVDENDLDHEVQANKLTPW